MNYFQRYNKCVFCGSFKLIKEKNKFILKIFMWMQSNPILIYQKQINKIIVHKCLNCNVTE